MTYTELIPEISGLDRADKLRIMQMIVSDLAREQENMDDEASLRPATTTRLDDDTERALQFYDEDLATKLEPAHIGEDVAIHIDTRTYEVAKGIGRAFRAMRAKQPNGSIVVHRIGVADARLAARMKGEKYL